MSDRLSFVDTNIFVYAYDNSNPLKQRIARGLLLDLWDKRNGRLSIQVMQELYVTLTRKLPAPLSSDQVLGIITDLSLWKHHIPHAVDILDAARLQKQFGLSFWDAMIINSAKKMGCEILWSEDLNAGQVYDGVRVDNPFLHSRFR